MKNRPEFKYVETPWAGDDYKGIHFAPISRTKKLLWGLWSKSETDIYFMLPKGVYKLDGNRIVGRTDEKKG